ncbi:MAG: sensor histidine kinase, partial [Spirochaetota bacterium]
SFSQGAGFGSLLTIIDIVVSSARAENDNFIVDREVFNLMTDNVKMAEKALLAFEDIDKLNSNDMNSEKVNFSQLHDLILSVSAETSSFAALKNNTIRISDLKPEMTSFCTEINREYLISALTELFMNAYKFSEPNTDIIVILDRLGDFIEIEFLNIPMPDDEGHKGIPMEYENLVFEPFFRMTKKIYEEYKTLDFGIGLTLVENVVAKHKGKVSASTVTDYSGKEKTGIQRVSISLELPIIS